MSLRLALRSEQGTRRLTSGHAHTLKLEVTVPTRPPVIVPGPAVPEDQAKSSATPRLYLIFGTLVDGKALEGLSIAAPGWETKYFEVPTPGWALTPGAGLTLAGSETISITIANVVCRDAQDGQLIVDSYNFGVPDGSVGLPISVRRSSEQDLNLDVRLVDPGALVFITGPGEPSVENSVSLAISNPSPTEALARKDATRTENAPTFRISCACGDAPGYGALTTKQRAADIRLETEAYKAEYADRWIAGGNALADPPYLELKALPSNADVLSAGAGGTLQLTLTNIVTELDPGVAQIYVEWRDIPGRRNGVAAVPILKVGKTRIVAFDANRTIVDFGKPQHITFPCEIEQATLVKLNGRTVGTADIPRTLTLAPTLDLSAATDVTLVAYGAGPDNVTTWPHPLRVITVPSYVAGKAFVGTVRNMVRTDDGLAVYHYQLSESIEFNGDLASYAFWVSGTWVPLPRPGEKRSTEGSRKITGPWRVSDGRIYLKDAKSDLELPFAFEERNHAGIIRLEKEAFVGGTIWGIGRFIAVPTVGMTTSQS